MSSDAWIDLTEPDRAELERAAGRRLHELLADALLRPCADTEVRPRLDSFGDHVAGILVVPVMVPDEDRVYFQEIGIVLDPHRLVTVRKAPTTRSAVTKQPDPPFEPTRLRAASSGTNPEAGMLAYHLLDEVADAFLQLVSDLMAEIHEVEENVESWPPAKVRQRIKELRHDFLHIRHVLTPTQGTLTDILVEQLDTEGDEVFSDRVEIYLRDTRDKVDRAGDGLDFADDQLTSVNDFHQSHVANEQNDVMKRFTVLASVLLLPTLIVGLYGQNFDNLPSTSWGVWWSMALIVLVTVGQLSFFYWQGWIGPDRRERTLRKRDRGGTR